MIASLLAVVAFNNDILVHNLNCYIVQWNHATIIAELKAFKLDLCLAFFCWSLSILMIYQVGCPGLEHPSYAWFHSKLLACRSEDTDSGLLPIHRQPYREPIYLKRKNIHLLQVSQVTCSWGSQHNSKCLEAEEACMESLPSLGWTDLFD